MWSLGSPEMLFAFLLKALSSLESVTTSYPFFYRPQSLRLGDAEYLHPPDHFYQQVALEVGASDGGLRAAAGGAPGGCGKGLVPLAVVGGSLLGT